jgi:hypothetical protein
MLAGVGGVAGCADASRRKATKIICTQRLSVDPVQSKEAATARKIRP